MENKASEKELTDAVKELLKSSGVLNRFQAEMRAKVAEALKEKQECKLHSKSNEQCRGPPTPNEEVLLINELVREYLEWNGYLYTASVMSSEAALPIEKPSRQQICRNVGVKDDEKSSVLPLLSNIVAAYTERIKRKLTKTNKKSERETL